MAAIKQAYLSLLVLVLAMLALSLAAKPSMHHYMDATVSPAASGGGGIVGDIGGGYAEMMMDSESSKRILTQTRYKSRYSSYFAFYRDAIPCGFRGKSYYNCIAHIPALPYRRGCSRLTHCASR